MRKRECGDCNACCQGWLTAEIEGVKMRPGTPCQHCTATGCGIYERRPDYPCKQFVCAWLQEDSPLPDDMHPDRCGAIVVLNRSWKGHQVILTVPTGADMPQETMERTMALAREQDRPMVYHKFVFSEDGEYMGFKNNGYGPPWFIELVKLSITEEDIFRL